MSFCCNNRIKNALDGSVCNFRKSTHNGKIDKQSPLSERYQQDLRGGLDSVGCWLR